MPHQYGKYVAVYLTFKSSTRDNYYISGLNTFTFVMARHLPTPGFMHDVAIIHTGSVSDCWLGFIRIGLPPIRITKLAWRTNVNSI
jgi:hypothetical protein